MTSPSPGASTGSVAFLPEWDDRLARLGDDVLRPERLARHPPPPHRAWSGHDLGPARPTGGARPPGGAERRGPPAGAPRAASLSPSPGVVGPWARPGPVKGGEARATSG